MDNVQLNVLVFYVSLRRPWYCAPRTGSPYFIFLVSIDAVLALAFFRSNLGEFWTDYFLVDAMARQAEFCFTCVTLSLVFRHKKNGGT